MIYQFFKEIFTAFLSITYTDKHRTETWRCIYEFPSTHNYVKGHPHPHIKHQLMKFKIVKFRSEVYLKIQVLHLYFQKTTLNETRDKMWLGKNMHTSSWHKIHFCQGLVVRQPTKTINSHLSGFSAGPLKTLRESL